MPSRSPEQIRRDMHDYVPEYYEDFREVTEILDSRAEESIKLTQDVQDVLNQFFVDTATWSLTQYEYIFGITHDGPRSIDERRSVIKSKMRGSGRATLALIKQVAEAYTNGEVDVENDSPTYTVTITFIGVRGVPTNLGDIEQALRDVVPAHLIVNFEFTYLSWDELDSYELTWDALEALGLTWDELETYRR